MCAEGLEGVPRVERHLPHPKDARRSGESSNQSGHNVSRPLKSLRGRVQTLRRGGSLAAMHGRLPTWGTGAFNLQAFHPSASPHDPEGLGENRTQDTSLGWSSYCMNALSSLWENENWGP